MSHHVAKRHSLMSCGAAAHTPDKGRLATNPCNNGHRSAFPTKAKLLSREGTAQRIGLFVAQHPYTQMLHSATRRPEIWRVFVALVLLLLAGAVVTPLIYGSLALIDPDLAVTHFTLDGDMAIGTTPAALFVLLAGFAVTVLACVLIAKRLHHRSLRDLTGPAPLMRAQFVTTLKWILPLLAVTLLLPWDEGPTGDILDNLSFERWLFWLPFALLGLIVQITAEELVFRGYLQSQITAATKSHFTGLVGAAILFGLGHITAADSLASLFPVIWATAFGLVAGDLTARAGTIGPACALHFVNNASAMLIMPQTDTMSGFGLMTRTADLDTLYTDPKVIAFEMLLLLVTWLTARLAIRR